MRDGADTADALDDLRRVARVAVFQDAFETTEHAACDMGVDDMAVSHFNLNLEMAFDAGDRIDG